MTTERILVVDDDREFAESIAMRCRGLGFEVETASTPLAAIANMVAHPPDLLCLDVNLPTGNGLDLCEYLVRDQGRAANTGDCFDRPNRSRDDFPLGQLADTLSPQIARCLATTSTGD